MSSLPPSPGSPPPRRKADDEPIDLEQSIREVEQTLLTLKARYAQVQADQQQQQELEQRLSQTQRQYNRERSKALQADLKQIKRQLDELEIALESQLFSWSGLKEVFWLAVRFGGLGVILGWVLRSLTR